MSENFLDFASDALGQLATFDYTQGFECPSLNLANLNQAFYDIAQTFKLGFKDIETNSIEMSTARFLTANNFADEFANAPVKVFGIDRAAIGTGKVQQYDIADLIATQIDGFRITVPNTVISGAALEAYISTPTVVHDLQAPVVNTHKFWPMRVSAILSSQISARFVLEQRFAFSLSTTEVGNTFTFGGWAQPSGRAIYSYGQGTDQRYTGFTGGCFNDHFKGKLNAGQSANIGKQVVLNFSLHDVVSTANIVSIGFTDLRVEGISAPLQ